MLHSNLSINKEGHLTVAGYDTVELAEKYGTPLYVIDRDKLAENCETYVNAMKKYFGEGSYPIYASKSLCFTGVYPVLNSCGMGADVVSSGELFTACRAGFPLNKVFYHGNNKTDQDIAFAMDKGIGYFVADNSEELDAINRIAGEKGIRQKVLLRITPGIDPHTFKQVITGNIDSKFGVGLTGGKAQEFVKQALGLQNIELCGYHCHVGSQIFDAAPFLDAVKTMVAFTAEIRDMLGFEPPILDIGGGIGVRYLESDPEIDIEGIIAEIAEVFKAQCQRFLLKQPSVIMEPGRSIAASAGLTLYSVGTVKEIPGVKNYVLVDGGMTDNPRYALYGSPYTVLLANKANSAADYPCTLAGRCCESGDILQENIMLPKPVRGDICAVLVTGAYNYSMSSHYNRMLTPAVLTVGKGGEKIAVRRETFEDLCRFDEL